MVKRSLGFWAGVAVGAVLAGAAGALLMRSTSPTTQPSATQRADRSPPPDRRASPDADPATPGPPPGAPLHVTGSPTRTGEGPTDGAPSGDLDPETRALLEAAAFRHHELSDQGRGPTEPAGVPSDPEERGQWVEDTVMILIEAVAPELDGVEVQRSCSADGSVCTIEGPWPGDDFAQRWIEAISDDVIRSDDLSGVTLSAFESVDTDAGTGFRITARAPAE